jgi:hypothetical protein
MVLQDIVSKIAGELMVLLLLLLLFTVMGLLLIPWGLLFDAECHGVTTCRHE